MALIFTRIYVYCDLPSVKFASR